MNIDLKNTTINVIIKYKNNKNIYFRFDDNASLVVSCPKNTLNAEIARLIKKNEDSIYRMYERALESIMKDSEFYLLGEKYNIVFQNDISDVKIEDKYIYARDEVMLEEFVKSKIDEVFNEEVNICKNCFNNLPSFKLKTRKMKTRWGVCNRKDNIITLNTELIKKKVELIDYVIIHEMAHFYEGNHSKNFWNIVALACPNYKVRRADLRK